MHVLSVVLSIWLKAVYALAGQNLILTILILMRRRAKRQTRREYVRRILTNRHFRTQLTILDFVNIFFLKLNIFKQNPPF